MLVHVGYDIRVLGEVDDTVTILDGPKLSDAPLLKPIRPSRRVPRRPTDDEHRRLKAPTFIASYAIVMDR